MTVAVFDRSLLFFGGGGNVLIGKALCGWPGLSPEGFLVLGLCLGPVHSQQEA